MLNHCVVFILESQFGGSHMYVTTAAESAVAAAAATTLQVVMRDIAPMRNGHRTGRSTLCSFTGAPGLMTQQTNQRRQGRYSATPPTMSAFLFQAAEGPSSCVGDIAGPRTAVVPLDPMSPLVGRHCFHFLSGGYEVSHLGSTQQNA